jgi:hypothetical protein
MGRLFKANERATRKHRKELRGAFSRRKEDTKKRIEELARNFQKELDRKQSIQVKENSRKLANFRASCESEGSFAKLREEHENQVKFAKTKLAGLDRDILQMRQKHAKQMDSVSAEITALEKAKRLLERRKKTEEQAIDEDYERKIQIEQVQIQHNIENLSKIYTPDENQRAQDIIEAARKVTEVLNQMNNKIMRDRRKRNSALRHAQTTCSDLRNNIRAISTGTREAELENQIHVTETSSAHRFMNFKAETREIITSLNTQIDEQQKLDSKLLQEIETMTPNDLIVHSQTTNKIHAEAVQNQSDRQNEKDQIQAEYEKQRTKTIKEHSFFVDQFKQKITEANQYFEDCVTKVTLELEEHSSQLSPKIEENTQNNTDFFSIFHTQSDQLITSIRDLTNRIHDISPFSSMNTNQKAIDKIIGRLHCVDDIIQATFHNILIAIHDAPTRVPEIEVPPTPLSPSSSNTSRREPFFVISASKLRRRRLSSLTPGFF